MRGVSDKNILDDFCIKFSSVVDKYCKYIVVSGFVVISSGRVRATEDIDMIIEKLSVDGFGKLHDGLVSKGFVCMQSDSVEEIYSYLRDGLAVRYTWRDKPLPEMEMKFVKDILDGVQVRDRVKLELTGLDVWFSSIEMNVAFKEELLKSDKDMKDAEHLRKVYEVDEGKVKVYKGMIRRFRLK